VKNSSKFILIFSAVLAHLALPPLHAGKETRVKIVGQPFESQCHRLIEQFAREHFERGSLTAGRFTELDSILRQAGVSSESRILVVNAIAHVASSTDPDPLFRYTLHALKNSERDKQFAICALHGGCKIKQLEGIQNYVEILPTYEVVSEDPTSHALSVEGTSRAPRSGERHWSSDARLLVMDVQGGKLTPWYNWVSAFFHETQHYAEFRLISDWVEASIALQNTQQSLDTFFEDYFLLQPDGRVYVSKDSFNIFRESRAYDAGTKALGLVLSTPPEEAHMRALAMAQLRKQVLESSLQAFNIHESNVFEFGRYVALQMLATIDRARSQRLIP